MSTEELSEWYKRTVSREGLNAYTMTKETEETLPATGSWTMIKRESWRHNRYDVHVFCTFSTFRWLWVLGGAGGGTGRQRHSRGKNGTWGVRFFCNFQGFKRETTFGGLALVLYVPWRFCFCLVCALLVVLARDVSPFGCGCGFEFLFLCFAGFACSTVCKGQRPATLRRVGATSLRAIGRPSGTSCLQQVCLVVALFVCAHG